MDIKLISFDLDGSFLDDGKNIPQRNLEALHAAAAQGVYIVPATGRIYDGLPEILKTLPFMRYYITANGAYIFDAKERKNISKAEIPLELALSFYEYADTLPAIYDCYKDNWGYMTRSMWEKCGDYVPNPGILKLVRDLRQPVDELKTFLMAEGGGLQKMQLFFQDKEARLRQLEELPQRFPDLLFSSSMPFNIEVNSINGSKGQALARLCSLLGLDISQTMAIGDGTNDRDMIVTAGIGVAMGNAVEELKAAADYVTGHCNDAGFAQAVEQFVLN